MEHVFVVLLFSAVCLSLMFGQSYGEYHKSYGPVGYSDGSYRKKYDDNYGYDKKPKYGNDNSYQDFGYGKKKYDDYGGYGKKSYGDYGKDKKDYGYDKKPDKKYYGHGRGGDRADIQLARDLVLLKMAMDMYGNGGQWRRGSGRRGSYYGNSQGYGYDKKSYGYDNKKDYGYGDKKKKSYEDKKYDNKGNSHAVGRTDVFGGGSARFGAGFRQGSGGGFGQGGGGGGFGPAGSFGGGMQFGPARRLVAPSTGTWVCQCKPFCAPNELEINRCPKNPWWKVCCKWVQHHMHKPYGYGNTYKKYDNKKYDDKKYDNKKYDNKKYDDKKYDDKKYDDKKYDDKKYDKPYGYGKDPGYGYNKRYGPSY